MFQQTYKIVSLANSVTDIHARLYQQLALCANYHSLVLQNQSCPSPSLAMLQWYLFPVLTRGHLMLPSLKFLLPGGTNLRTYSQPRMMMMMIVFGGE